MTALASEPRPGRLPVIVLAGGRSRRFRGDKLTALVEEQPALARVVARVRPLASTVTVSTSSEARRTELAGLLPPTVHFLLDRPDRWGRGPAGAIARALEEVARGPVLFVPGDMPWLETRALARFVARAEAASGDVASPFWQSGETEHLLQWHRNGETSLAFSSPSADPSSARRASVYLRAAPRTLLVPIAALSSRPVSFSHLTCPSDVERPAPRGEAGHATRARLVEGVPKRRYHEARAHLMSGRRPEAARDFAAESRWYATEGLRLLARHALMDAEEAECDEPVVRAAHERLERLSPTTGSGRVTVNRNGRLRAGR
jgi:molybdopterin-guanine dinucleotide biosynthesis protein A